MHLRNCGLLSSGMSSGICPCHIEMLPTSQTHKGDPRVHRVPVSCDLGAYLGTPNLKRSDKVKDLVALF